MPAPAVAIALVTCPPAIAEPLAERLLEAGVAACVNVLPGLRSLYRWQGELQRDEESLLLVKHPVAGFEALRAEVLRHHPYELPEIVAVPLSQGHAPYLDWVLAACQ